MTPFLVCQFEKFAVSNLVKECFGADFPDIFKKNQFDYIFRYLKDLGAQSVLLEFEYVDRDYIEDYSRYYVKRFNSLGHRCARLHFFAGERGQLDHQKIDEMLATGDDEFRSILQRDYLGFVVVKPLPKTFIGRTCLKHYPGFNEGPSKRALTRAYNVNLFGVDLVVDSIAFQEQDKVVSACATTSIWSALHALNWRQVRDIPSCSEITTNAINFIVGSSNSFPKTELSNKQMLRALDVEGLRHHTESLLDVAQDELFETVRSYIDSGLPLILGAGVYSSKNDASSKLGGHAVSVVGYKSAGGERALYIHDDRLGPFARATFVHLESAHGWSEGAWGLELQKKGDDQRWLSSHEILVPNVLITATHQKVRLPLSYARNTARLIVEIYEERVRSIAGSRTGESADNLLGQVTFQVKLAEISDLKKSYFDLQPEADFIDSDGRSSALSEGALSELKKEKTSFLTTSFARFQWVVDFSYAGRLAFSMFVDATDIPQGHAVSAILTKNPFQAEAILTPLRGIVRPRAMLDGVDSDKQNFFGSFLRRLKREGSDFEDHLDKTYGELRAPRYLKADEFEQGELRINQTTQTYYEATGRSLNDVFPMLSVGDKRIWAINRDGALLIGEEIEGMGHPCLTGFKPARIAGELKRTTTGWSMNTKSGRYSGDYRNVDELLANAIRKFRAIFDATTDVIEAEPRPPAPLAQTS